MAVITTWADIQDTYYKYAAKTERWLFRGQRRADWDLLPSLERAVRRFGISFSELASYERRMLREFIRHFHRYSQYLPEENDKVEWLSLMQHHGTPTRLLDWTYSFYIALFFAIESALPGERCAIWAVNHDYCWELVRTELPYVAVMLDINDKDPNALNQILASNKPLVCPLNSLRLNARLAVQQGVFLAAASTTQPFMESFKLSFGTKASSFEKIEIECSKDFLIDALKELQRVNITRVSLFPGLDGFAQSLENLIPLQHLWKYS